MFKIIKNTVKEIRNRQRKILSSSLENEWANVYHDSIRGKEWLTSLSLNIGRWAGNYTFFYLLNRILTEVKPKNILEFGLGESSKFISKYLESDLTSSNHMIIEESEEWKERFINQFELNSRSNVWVYPLAVENINGNDVNVYSNLHDNLKDKFDLYVIDGPFGSEHYSRYDVVKLAEQFNSTDEFIMIFDDYNRIGEQETINVLMSLFKKKKIKIYRGIYVGNKRVLVLGTQKYKFIESL